MKKLSWVFIFLSLCSCRQPKELVYEDVENFSLTAAGMQQTTLGMDVRLYNPNNYGMKLRKSAIDVFLNGKPAGTINIPGRTLIARRDTTLIPVTLDVNLKSLVPNLLQAIADNGVDVKLSGYLRAGRHGLFIRVPVNYEGRQDILGGLIKM